MVPEIFWKLNLEKGNFSLINVLPKLIKALNFLPSEPKSVSQFLLIEILKDAGLVGILSSQFFIHFRTFFLHLGPPLLAGIRPRCEVLQLDEGVLD